MKLGEEVRRFHFGFGAYFSVPTLLPLLYSFVSFFTEGGRWHARLGRLGATRGGSDPPVVILIRKRCDACLHEPWLGFIKRIFSASPKHTHYKWLNLAVWVSQIGSAVSSWKWPLDPQTRPIFPLRGPGAGGSAPLHPLLDAEGFGGYNEIQCI